MAAFGLFVSGNDQTKLTLGTRNGYIQQVGIVHECPDRIVYGGHYDGLFLASLEFVYRRYFDFSVQLPGECGDLLVVGRDDTDFSVVVREVRHHLAGDDLDFPLIEPTACVVARDCSPGGDHIGFAPILGHDDELPAIELPVAEVDDFRMTPIVFAQQCLRSVGKNPADRF